MDISERPNLRGRLEEWIKKYFHKEEDLRSFSVFIYIDGLICMVRGDEGYVFGEKGSDKTRQIPYVAYARDKQGIISQNGFTTDFVEDKEGGTCGFSFHKA